MKKEITADNDSFVPTGAIVFFISLTIFFAAVWFGFYALMILQQTP